MGDGPPEAGVINSRGAKTRVSGCYQTNGEMVDASRGLKYGLGTTESWYDAFVVNGVGLDHTAPWLGCWVWRAWWEWKYYLKKDLGVTLRAPEEGLHRAKTTDM